MPDAHAAPAATPAADAGHAAPAKEPFWKHGYTKAGVTFCIIIAFGFGLGSISQEVHNFLQLVVAYLLQIVTDFKSAIFMLLAFMAGMGYVLSKFFS